MPMELPVLLLIAVAALGTAHAVYRRTDARVDEDGPEPRATHAHRPSPLAAFVDLVDASIGMHLLRQALGRPTTTRAERGHQALVAAEELERRRTAGVPAAVAPTRLVVAGTAASHSRRDLPDRQAHPVATQPVGRTWTDRPPVSREGAFVAMALLVVGLAVFAIWPRVDGRVLSTTGTPAPLSPPPVVPSVTSVSSESPTVSVAPTAVVSATPSPTPTPTATPTPVSVATAKPTARPTARPTATPRRTARPTPKPTATAAATPSPDPTPEPTAAPTAAPTPEPTPVPTPEPTPESTPEAPPSI